MLYQGIIIFCVLKSGVDGEFKIDWYYFFIFYYIKNILFDICIVWCIEVVCG
jgi:hypothetical protein